MQENVIKPVGQFNQAALEKAVAAQEECLVVHNGAGFSYEGMTHQPDNLDQLVGFQNAEMTEITNGISGEDFRSAMEIFAQGQKVTVFLDSHETIIMGGNSKMLGELNKQYFGKFSAFVQDAPSVKSTIEVLREKPRNEPPSEEVSPEV